MNGFQSGFALVCLNIANRIGTILAGLICNAFQIELAGIFMLENKM